MFNFSADETVPVYQFGDDGTVRNVRPSLFMREAMSQVERVGTSGQIGYIVENQYGHRKPMTFLQHARLKDLFERGVLREVDRWVVHHVPPEYGLTGFDTEATRSGVFRLG